MGYFQTWILILCVMSQGNAAKVVVLPNNIGSHLLYFGQVASALADTGHDVTMYVPSNNKAPQELSAKVNVIIYKVPAASPFVNSAEMARLQLAVLNAQSSVEAMQHGMQMMSKTRDNLAEDCKALLSPEVYGPLSSAGHQLIIMDSVGFACQYAVSYKLGLPYITLSIPFNLWGYRIPHLSSHWPHIETTTGNRMDFQQRLSNFLTELRSLVYTDNTDEYVRKYVGEKAAVGAGDLMYNSSMWWYLYDVAVGYPKPAMPNTLDVGDIMVRPARPLPQEFQQIMEDSVHGVIFVSLGSYFEAVPESWLQEFCRAFTEYKYTVIWRLTVTPPCQITPNVHIRPWVPQNDLLAHPKLVLFVTHCGLNSILESVSHGKPMVGFPISIDQPYNAHALKDKGMAEVLDLRTFTSQDLTLAMDKVLTDPTYKRNTQRGAKLLRDKPQRPAEKLSFWVNHVLEFGNDHMVSAAKELNLFQFLMLDIYLFLFSVGFGIILMCLSFVYCCCICLKRRFISADIKAHRE